MNDPLLSEDAAVIRAWAKEALAHGLYREDGLARSIFQGKAKIHHVAYLPGIAWAMRCDLPPPWEHLAPMVMAYTRPDHRRKGLCRSLVATIKVPRDCAESDIMCRREQSPQFLH